MNVKIKLNPGILYTNQNTLCSLKHWILFDVSATQNIKRSHQRWLLLAVKMLHSIWFHCITKLVICQTISQKWTVEARNNVIENCISINLYLLLLFMTNKNYHFSYFLLSLFANSIRLACHFFEKFTFYFLPFIPNRYRVISYTHIKYTRIQRKGTNYELMLQSPLN